MSSSECMNMIKKYEKKIYEISNLYIHLENCTSSTNKCKEVINNTKINGETIDKGKLEDILDTMKDLREVFNTIITECKLKIDEYNVLYQEALKSEMETNNI